MSFFGIGVGLKLFWSLFINTNYFCFLNIPQFELLSCSFEFVVGGSQQLHSLKPTIVLFVYLLGLWLLLGCDNKIIHSTLQAFWSAKTL